MTTILQDLRYGLRMLAKKPGFTAVAVLTLALGISANSAIFSIINAVLLRPLPLKEPERIIKVWERSRNFQGTVSVPNLKDWREQNDVFTEIAIYQFGSVNLRGRDNPERAQVATVSPNFFNVLGVPPHLGRTFQANEDRAGRHRVVMLSDQMWQQNFGADPNIVGQNMQLGGEDFTIIGVMPPSFRFPLRSTELWVPVVYTAKQLIDRDEHFFFAVGRLKDGVTFEQAQEQMKTIAQRIEQQYPEVQAGRSVLLIPLQEEMVQNVRQTLLVLLGAVGCVLLIACTNVANLLLARAASRRKEVAIRTALGAGRGRLLRQLLTESMLLAVMGGALGLLMAKWGLDLLLALAANFLPRANEVSLDGRVVGFTLLLSVLTGIVFGLMPALNISKADVQASLKEGGGSGDGPQSHGLRSLLVVAEVALALVLLVGAGLMIKSFVRLQQTETGLQAQNVLTLSLALPEAKYRAPQTTSAFYAQLLGRIESLPGVETAGAINFLPLQRAGFNDRYLIEGPTPPPPGQEPVAEQRAITPDYFRVLGIPLVAGRFFNAQDNEQAASVAIINQTLARRSFAGQNPIGQRVRTFDSIWMTVVGVVGDVKQSGITRPIMPEIFVPTLQVAPSKFNETMARNMSLAVRTASDPMALLAAVRGAVKEIDPAQPIGNVKTMETVVAESVADRRLNMLLLGVFAAVALTLAITGIYSVMSYTATQSTREIGIRIALGAQASDVLKLIVGHGAVLSLIGVALGVVAALGLTRLMETLLYGVTATDPLTFVGVSALLMMVALVACYVPARRATKVDPMVALRYE